MPASGHRAGALAWDVLEEQVVEAAVVSECERLVDPSTFGLRMDSGSAAALEHRLFQRIDKPPV
jgi:hypothetical protein